MFVQTLLIALSFLCQLNSASYISAIYPIPPSDRKITKGEDFQFQIIINQDSLQSPVDKFDVFMGRDLSFLPDLRYALVLRMNMTDLETAMRVNNLVGNRVSFRCKHPNFSQGQGKVYFGFKQHHIDGSWSKHTMSERISIKKRRFWQVPVPLVRDLTESCRLIGSNEHSHASFIVKSP